MRFLHLGALLWAALISSLAACSDDESGRDTSAFGGTGTSTASGPSTVPATNTVTATGTVTSPAVGTATGTAGTSSVTPTETVTETVTGTSTVAGTGGAPGAGGVESAGGTQNTGGAESAGGAQSTGGTGTGAFVGTGGQATGGTEPTLPCDQQPEMTIHMIGDSTMYRRWGDILGDYFDDRVTVVNYARAGRSTKSFRDEGHWDEVQNAMAKDDWLIVQFGHNDEKDDPERHTDPFTTFADNLQAYALAAQAKGAHPIICTPIVRLNLDSHGDYPDGAIFAAEEIGVPLVDIHAKTRDHVGSMDNPRSFYSDSSHPTSEGSRVVAEFFVADIQAQNLPLACYLR